MVFLKKAGLIVKAIFLDRDGIINKDLGYVCRQEDFIFVRGIFKVLKKLVSMGFIIIVITNQSGIGRGYYKLSDFQELTSWMLKKFSKRGVLITDVLYCPHAPTEGCDCRKPSPYLFHKAKNLYDIDFEKSWMIGDKITDIESATSAGVAKTILVNNTSEEKLPSYVISDISECIKIVGQYEKGDINI